MSDSLIYDFSLSSEKLDAPFIKKEMQYVNDTNSSKEYTTHQVIFDSFSLSSNGRWNDYRNGYIAIPIVIAVTGLNGGNAVDFSGATAKCSDFLIALKNSNLQLISSIQLEYQNSQVIQTQANLNQYLIFKQHTTLSTDDELLNGSTIGYWMDEPTSWDYLDAVGGAGEGIINNRMSEISIPSSIENFGKQLNPAPIKRNEVFNKYGGAGGREKLLYSTNTTKLKDRNLNYVDNTSTYKVYHYTAILRLRDLHDLFDKMPLVKGAQMKLTLNVNQCYFQVTKTLAGGNLTYQISNTVAPNGTVPVMFSANHLSLTSNNVVLDGSGNAVPTVSTSRTGLGASNIPAGTYTCSVSVVKNIWSSQAEYGASDMTHKLTNCRLYLPCYTLENDHEKEYLSAMPQKTIKYVDTFYKAIEGISTGSDVQFQITSSVVAPKRLIIVPMLAKEDNGVTSKFYPRMSPFATEPATCSPYLMSNFQVFVSSNPVYPQFQNYSYEMFLNEMNNFGLDGNLVSGMVSSKISYTHYINNYGYIVVNLSRRLPEDENTAVSLDIAFKLESQKKMDFYCFVETEKSITLNMINGGRIA